jgi:hypothetical protein
MPSFHFRSLSPCVAIVRSRINQGGKLGRRCYHNALIAKHGGELIRYNLAD